MGGWPGCEEQVEFGAAIGIGVGFGIGVGDVR